MNSTQLKDRELLYDGDSIFPSSVVTDLLNLGHKPSDIYVNELTDDIKMFNKLCRHDQQISVKTIQNPLMFNWVIPEQYSSMNVYDRLMALLVVYCEQLESIDGDTAASLVERVDIEYNLYVKHDKIDVLKTMFYIVDTLTQNQIVWGVGRGSSVSSFLLYLIGVHDVDSFAYGLEITDFLA